MVFMYFLDVSINLDILIFVRYPHKIPITIPAHNADSDAMSTLNIEKKDFKNGKTKITAKYP